MERAEEGVTDAVCQWKNNRNESIQRHGKYDACRAQDSKRLNKSHTVAEAVRESKVKVRDVSSDYERCCQSDPKKVVYG